MKKLTVDEYMTSLPIGEEIIVNGVKLRIEKSIDDKDKYKNCYFDKNNYLCTQKQVYTELPWCFEENRIDNTEIIFMEVKE